MLKSILFSAAALMAFSSASAQTPALEIGANAEEITATPAMWRVVDEDSEFILLGTFHILPPNLNWRTNALNDAVKNADIVYFEVETDAADVQSRTLSVMMTEGFNKPGTTLTGMLNVADADNLRNIVRELGLPLAGVDPMRPWQAFLTLSVQFIIKQGFTPGSGVDSVLLNESRTLGKELRFFESLEEQLELFTGLSPETEKSLLELTIRDWDAQAESFDDLFTAWRQGDEDFIDIEMNQLMREQAPEIYARLITDRNVAWADKIAETMTDGEGAALVAVGAAHLVGEDGVPALLAAKGFEVSRYGVAANDNAASE